MPSGSLMGVYTLDRFSAKGDNFFYLLYFTALEVPFERGLLCKKRSKFFPYKVDPWSERSKINVETKLPDLTVYHSREVPCA